MFKKIIALILSLSLAVMAFSSCNISDNSSDIIKTYDDNYRNFYEIYVRSFSDSDGDGIGDLNGVLSKLDYLKAANEADDSKSLGIDGVWFMPIFTSPSQHKYDVTDYYSIDPTYGTMQDFENIINQFHQRGIRVIIDMIINHTSNEHPWFKQAVEAINNNAESKYINYYNFTTEPPLDADGNISGYSPVAGNTNGYYYESQFVDTMPDLNLSNPDTINDIKDIMKFWIEKGVDGYRLDACKHYFTEDAYKSIEFLKMTSEYCKSINPEFYLIGEVWDSDYVISEYYKSGMDSFFNFDCSYVGHYQGLFNNIYNGDGQTLSKRVEEWNELIRNNNPSAIDAPFLSNHDTTRSGSYLKNSSDRKLAASLYMMLPGNSFIYYGEEIGMTEGWQNDSDKRLPIKWSSDEDGSTITPPAGAHYISPPFHGVYDQLNDKDSLLNHYKALIKLKNQNPEIQRAQVVSACDLKHPNVAAYTSAYSESSVMIIHNVTATPKQVDIASNGYDSYTIMRGFITASDYVDYEEHQAYMESKEYDLPEFTANASPITYVNGVLTIPPKTTVILKNSESVNSTFVPTINPCVTPSDVAIE